MLLLIYMTIQALFLSSAFSLLLHTWPLIHLMHTCRFNLILQSFIIIFIIIIISWMYNQNDRSIVFSFNEHILLCHRFTFPNNQSLDIWITPPSSCEVLLTWFLKLLRGKQYFSSHVHMSCDGFLSPDQAHFMRKWTVFLLINLLLLVT